MFVSPFAGKFAATLAVLLAVTGPQLPAQEVRFELGRRLRAMEEVWETAEPAARRRAVDPLNQAVRSFFGFRLGQAAKLLDEARFVLQSAEAVSPAARWATSLEVVPERLLNDVAPGKLRLNIRSLYSVTARRPEQARLELRLSTAVGLVAATAIVELRELPQTVDLACPGIAEGDYQLSATLHVADDPIPIGVQTVSFAVDAESRRKQLDERVAALRMTADPTQWATLDLERQLVGQLAGMVRPETNYPAAHLLRNAEAAVASLGRNQPYYGAALPGEAWLALSAGGRQGVVRVAVPATPPAARWPVVIALHGAGGSENMFFDGYGAGKIRRLCADRGWLLVCPRSGLFGGGLPLDGLVAALEKLYPLDRERLFVVGHSMGAGQALSGVATAQTAFTAVAALGGGRPVRSWGQLQTIPLFVAAGSADFGLSGARAVVRSVEEAGGRVTWQLYDDVEHLVVVQAALDDVFQFFDAARP